MSEVAQGPDDWQASDGLWYPAAQHPARHGAWPGVPGVGVGEQPAAPGPDPGAPGPGAVGHSPRTLMWLVGGLAAALVLGGVVLAIDPGGSSPGPGTAASSTPSSTASTVPPTSSTTTATSAPSSTGVPTTPPATPGALAVPPSEPQLHGGDIGATRTLLVGGQPLQMTLVAVVYPATSIGGAPASSDPFATGPIVGLAMTVRNAGKAPIDLELVSSSGGGTSYEPIVQVTVAFNPNTTVGADLNTPGTTTTALGTLLAMSTPLAPGETRTGWLTDDEGSSAPDAAGTPSATGPPTAVTAGVNGAGPGSVSVGPGSATWTLP